MNLFNQRYLGVRTRFIQRVLVFLGIAMIGLALVADRLVMDSTPGFGSSQVVFATVGFVLFLSGFALRVTMTRLQEIYTSCAIMLLNTILIFIVINVILEVGFSIKKSLSAYQVAAARMVAPKSASFFNEDGSPVNNGRRTSYQLKWFDFNAYENIDQGYAATVLEDFYELGRLGFIYQPWVQFSEPAFKGNLVSIGLDPRGFPVRRTLNPRNDEGLPIIRIFTLGGSTTFGYNVSDEHTWPSHLSSILNEKSKAEGIGIHVEVVNYGRGYYTPSQETLLLTDLLKSGHRPNVAIFMDGVNLGSSQDIPAFSEKLDRWFTGLQFRNDTSLLDALTWMPIVRLSRSIGHSVFDKNGNPEKAATRNKEKKWDKENVQNMVNRFEQNREISSAICKLYSVECYFMLQPNPLYNYPLKLYRMSLGESYMEGREIAQQFYERMRGEKGILWLADLFESWGHDRKAIVDDLHYSPGFNHFLAQHVAKHMDMKSLSPKAEIINEAAVTGSSRRLSEMGTRGNR